jgi:hypothetical protein
MGTYNIVDDEPAPVIGLPALATMIGAKLPRPLANMAGPPPCHWNPAGRPWLSPEVLD